MAFTIEDVQRILADDSLDVYEIVINNDPREDWYQLEKFLVSNGCTGPRALGRTRMIVKRGRDVVYLTLIRLDMNKWFIRTFMAYIFAILNSTSVSNM